jgi:hypothetical protein
MRHIDIHEMSNVLPCRRRRPREVNPNQHLLIDNPTISVEDFETLKSYMSSLDTAWQTIWVHASRRDGGFVVISCRGDQKVYTPDIIVSPSRVGYLVFSHDARIFERGHDYPCCAYRTIDQVCDGMRVHSGANPMQTCATSH